MAQVMAANRAAEFVKDSMTIAIGGFGSTGVPFKLIEALVRRTTEVPLRLAEQVGTFA